MGLRKQSLREALKPKIFHNIPNPDKELIELSDLFITRTISRSNMLVRTGERWKNIFYIHQGILRLFYTDNEGREFNKGFFWEEQFVWPVAPSARKEESLFTISALEELVVSVCPFTTFYSWLLQHGYWEKFALPYAESFAEQKFLREYEFLVHSATERFRHFCRKYPALVKRIPDYHIASYLGITNVSLSRIKNSATVNIC